MDTSTDAPTGIIYNSRFCDECHNLMIVWTNPTNGASMFRCRRCNKKTEISLDTKRVVMLVRNYNDRPSIVDKGPAIPVNIMLHDPTLPRIHSKCPVSETCNSKITVYTKTDESSMRFQYVCSHGHTWTTDDLHNPSMKNSST